MPLTHVCIWEPKIGYRRISIEEACERHPQGASAKSGFFVCELCAQNVVLTAPGINVQHFRHDSSTPNKECDDRQAYFDPTYGHSLSGLNSHAMPLKISVKGSNYSLELGFFYPPNRNVHCDKIRILPSSSQTYEYSFERIEHTGTTYLNVGSIPSHHYTIEYVNANMELKKFWSTKVVGINSNGSFFDGRTGHILQQGAKAYADNDYYLLQKKRLISVPSDISALELTHTSLSSYSAWYLYRVRIRNFSEDSAKFFLKYALFLTEKPTKFYPLWPPYIEDPYFIYHNASEFYFYLCGDDAVLKAFPSTASSLNTHNGRLYKISTRDKEQLVSIGKSGALGFSYLIKQPLHKRAALPSVTITDVAGNELNEDTYSKLPKSKTISVACQYDGKAVAQRKGVTEYVHRMSADHVLQINELRYGTEIQFYQGCDCVRTIRFESHKDSHSESVKDEILVKKLMTCAGPTMTITHTIGAFVSKYSSYPKTRQWLYTVLRHGEISREAYRLLIDTITRQTSNHI